MAPLALMDTLCIECYNLIYICLNKVFRKMGGANSGRRRVSNVSAIECNPTLDIRRLRRLKFLRIGFVTQASWV